MTDSVFARATINHFHNPKADTRNDWPAELSDIMGPVAIAQAGAEIRQWESYAPTQLRSFDGLADKLKLGSIFYKDEGTRFGLGSFKALGGAYAVLCLLQQQLSKKTEREISFEEIRSGSLAEQIKDITVATATDGNHGRSVAWGAKQFGCNCEIYIHAEVSEGRQQSMEELGARVTRVNGNYDESVHLAASDAEKNGWFIVSDTSYPGYVDLPRHVAAGYTVFMDEAMEAIADHSSDVPPISHVFVQGGVGGLASAVCGYLWQKYGARRPRFVIVEPNLADCLFQSAKNGEPTVVDIQEETVMAGLSCGEVSYLGWQILEPCVDDFLTITDDLVAPTMCMLADGMEGAAPVVAGESAVAGLAALIALGGNDALKNKLGLDENSRVLLIGTEGATDEEIYEQIVGRASRAVA